MRMWLIIILLSVAATSFSQILTTDSLINDVDIDSQEEVRLNPEIVYGGEENAILIPSFIKKSANHIKLNGDDWSDISGKQLEGKLTIVHIGDSHIQAEFGTSITREMLQLRYGNAGRGLITPFRLEGTNQPRDYGFESSSRWTAEKVMRAPWSKPMGFNGASLSLVGHSGNITLSTTESEDEYNPFSRITLFYKGDINITGIKDENGVPIVYTIAKHLPGEIELALWSQVDKVTIDFDVMESLTLFGAVLSNERNGVMYHAIGNNGAAYQTYCHIPDMAEGVSSLNPDIIIVSLGTNEAFGRLSTATFRSCVDQLVTRLRKNNPSAHLLLVTPMECRRRVTRKVGRRRSVTSYEVNPNILPLRNVLLSYASKNGIAVYDWYDVAGGTGASTQWNEAELFGKDGVHHTVTGYRINGRLLYDALQEAIDK